MTEAEWLASEDAASMIASLVVSFRDKISDRKLRLFVEACRARWPQHAAKTDLNDPTRLRQAVSQWGHTKSAAPAREIAHILRDLIGNPFRPVTLPPGPLLSSEWSCRVCGAEPDDDGEVRHGKGCYRVSEDGGGTEWVERTRGPSPWLTADVVMLATRAYEDRERKCDDRICQGRGRWADAAGDMDDCARCQGTGTVSGGALDPLTLAVLADALEEAGAVDAPCGVGATTGIWAFPCRVCLSSNLLAHLRSPGPHYLGCWALDLLLGKS